MDNPVEVMPRFIRMDYNKVIRDVNVNIDFWTNI